MERDALEDLMSMAEKVTVFGVGSAKGPKAIKDWKLYYKERKRIFAKDMVWSNAKDTPPESWYETYVKPFRSSTKNWEHWV